MRFASEDTCILKKYFYKLLLVKPTKVFGENCDS